MITVRNYESKDYPAVAELYKDTATFGGQFDEARDTEARLSALSDRKPEALLVAEKDGTVVGTVTLFEDGRVAWLYRFAVRSEGEGDISKALWEHAREILQDKGHEQVLVLAPVGDKVFEYRYTELGFTKGNDYTTYWQDL